MCGSGLPNLAGHVGPPLRLPLLVVGNRLRKIPCARSPRYRIAALSHPS